MKGTYEIRIEGQELDCKETLEFKDNDVVVWSIDGLEPTYRPCTYEIINNRLIVNANSSLSMVTEEWIICEDGSIISTVSKDRYLHKQ